jgi:sensor histidine kinase regulating citrate/malate metabolism
MKIIRHDTRHVLTIVSTLLKEGKKKKAIEFIDEQINIIDSTKVATYCKDALINAIIYYYKELCDKNNINLKIRIKNIDKQLKISTSEVAIVLANCLENAFKAVNKLKENREIDFKFINNDGVLLMQISNNYEGTIKLDRKNRPIAGSSNHGIGTKSIQEFVSKYNLMLDYEITDTRFSISIIF